MIAGRFDPVCLCQLLAKLFCMQLTKAYRVETSGNQLIHCVFAHDLPYCTL